MRIAGYFIRTLITIAIVGALVYFLGGQPWMAVSLRGFIAETRDLETAKQSLATYTRRCQTDPAASSFSTPIAVQLRFLDSTHYQTELRCTLIEDAPIILSSGELPRFVAKTMGSSGFYVDLQAPTTSTITLKSFAATKTFTVDTTSQYNDGRTSSQTSPATTCTGWGYRCCNPDQEKGSGAEQGAGVTDCSTHCFSACSPLPYIQGFTSDPYPSSPGTISMGSPQLTVTFSYVATLLGGDITAVHMDYGDGTFEDATTATGSFVHTYSCPGKCNYLATIVAKDAHGNLSVVNDSTKLYIKKE